MTLAEKAAALLDRFEQAILAGRLAVPLAVISLVLAVMLLRRGRKSWPAPSAPAEGAGASATTAAAQPGPAETEDDADPAVEAFALVRPGIVALMVLCLSAAIWLLGLALAPDRGRFAASREWHIQPLYLGAHLVAVSLFVAVLRNNFEAGVARMSMAPETAIAVMRMILGPAGMLAALAIATPLCFLDYQYLLSSRYEKLGGDGVVRPVDLLMWAIWCVEWFLNAFLWVMLAGFTAQVVWIIARYRFRAPIEVVLHEKQYRPFLQMSAQGSTVLLAFSLVSLIYILYAGGEISDYVGLAISVVLLVAAFTVPWLQLRSKVRALVVEETKSLRRDLYRRVQERGAAPASVEHRVDEMLAMLRISHAEHLQINLGWTEAKLLMLRLIAPALTIAWQLVQHGGEISRKASQLLNEIGTRLGGWW